MTVLEWIMAVVTVVLWGYNFTFLLHRRIYEWFDNKFGRDDPLPPTLNQSDKKHIIKS